MSAAVPIDIRVARVEALFESLDPSPFHERDLDAKANDYILGWAQEYPSDARFQLRIHLPAAEAERAAASDIGAAIRANFSYWFESVGRERRELFRLGRVYLIVGLAVLASCLVLRRALPGLFGDNAVTRFLAEGLSILGWVSNWKPIETFLYDWWPLYRKASLYRRLAEAEVVVVAV